MTPTRLLASTLLLVLAAAAGAAPRACDESAGLTIIDSRFTSGVRSDHRAQDDLPFLRPALTRVYLHITTRGSGTLTFRWRRDGRSAGDRTVSVGAGTWHSWSSLPLRAAMPAQVEVDVLGPGGCLLLTRSLAASAYGLSPLLDEALELLATGDLIGARIALNTLLEDNTLPVRTQRAARRVQETDLAVAQAAARLQADEIFLVEESLRGVERRLGRSAADRALRERVARVRQNAALRSAVLAREHGTVALATRHLLETHKLFAGDYPMEASSAQALVSPALAHAGDTYALVEWIPTLRGYRLLLQDKRTGDTFEVTPDN